MIISLIAALTSNHVIGINNTIPWHLPSDLIWFKRNTDSKSVIMGRKTFESIGQPLSGRKNIVLSRANYHNEANVYWSTTPEQALSLASLEVKAGIKEVMIIGGAKIFQLFLPQAKRLYLTYIDTVLYGDTFFPDYNRDEWYALFTETHCANHQNMYNYNFHILERRHLILNIG